MPNPTQGGVPDGAVEACLRRNDPHRERIDIAEEFLREIIKLDLQAAAPFFRKHFEEELLSDEAKGALYDADMRYQNVDPREQSEDGWAEALLQAALSVSREGGR